MDFHKLIVGSGTALLGVVISHQAVNEWLQTISLLLGSLVALITLLSFVFKWKKKK